MNYNGGPGPSSTGTAPPIPREPMRQSTAPLPPPGEYRSDYRSDYRPEYRPELRSDGYRSLPRDDERSALPPSGDTSVRVAGLPEPYDRAQPLDRAPLPRSTSPSVPYDTARAPVRPAPAPPRAAFTPLGETPPAQGETIEVRPGDTLYKLSKTHGIPVSELMRANNLTGPQLRVGQQLSLPTDQRRGRRVAALPTPTAPDYMPPPAYVPPAPARSTAPARIPSEAGPIVPPLVEVPPLAPAPVTTPLTPTPTPIATPSSSADDSGWSGTYTVTRGDSLYAIARKHGVKIAELERVNEITNPRKVMPGTVLKVPKPGDTPRVGRMTQAPPVALPPPLSRAPRLEPARLPAPTAAQDTLDVPSVQPRILNPRERVATEDGKRVASLDRGVSDESSVSAPEPASSVTVGAPRQAALPAPTAATPPGKFRWPARGKIISAFGGPPGTNQNDGIKISVPRGTDVHAAEGGVITYAGDEVQGYGNLVIIRHPEGWITAYAHNDGLMVKTGDTVRRGQIIAKAGNTGGVSQPQLHFEVRHGATPVDPVPHLER